MLNFNPQLGLKTSAEVCVFEVSYHPHHHTSLILLYVFLILVPQAKLFLHLPKQMDAIFNSAPHALMRVLMGHPLMTSLPALLNNSRVGRSRPIPTMKMRDVVLNNIPAVPYKAWVYFYHFGLPLPNQMELQINSFKDYKGNVYIMQGADDGGQVNHCCSAYEISAMSIACLYVDHMVTVLMCLPLAPRYVRWDSYFRDRRNARGLIYG
jgi:hypothetical protein